MAIAVARVAQPFTVEHFRAWSAEVILDDGEPWDLEPFQEAFLDDVFSGIPECWLVVPEENGKTTLVAGLALYHSEFRTQAAVPVAASSREQAEILYRQAEGMVARSPSLHERMHSDLQVVKGKLKTEIPRFVCLEGYRRINHYRGGRIQVFAADDRTGDGQLPTLGILEELHRQRHLGLYRTWSGKLRKRQGQLVAISTAGEPGSDFELTREKIRQAATSIERKGAFTRAVAGPVILHEYAVAEDGDPADMRQVKAANPFRRITVASLKAKYHSPTMTEIHWRRFVCNLPTRGSDAAITEAEWEAAKVDDQIPGGKPIWLGVDPGWKWDTFAMVPLWIRDPEYRLFGPATVIIPPRDSSALHPDVPMAALRTIQARNPITKIVMDTSQSHDLAHRIESELGIPVVDRPQTDPLAAADYALFMEALRNGWLHHTGDEGLTRHALNAIAHSRRGGPVRFDRPVEGRLANQEQRVIDALSAASMVHSLASAPEPEPSPEPFVLVGR